MPTSQRLVVLDLEGVLYPEIWPALSEHFSIPELAATTRDVDDYRELMRLRVAALNRNDVAFTEMLSVITALDPLPGAVELLDVLRLSTPVVILSDTFEEFAASFSAKLHYPTVLCHRLVVSNDRVLGFKLRLPDQKRSAVEAFQRLNYYVVAAGDSFNDLSMLHAADYGILVNPPVDVASAHPRFHVCTSVDSLRAHLAAICTEPTA
jgi:phosphoserine/homoserine phosphotransferase